ncbi:galactose oxidase, partial [Suhomyces tanzawaensis NRRL Y-17324]
LIGNSPFHNMKATIVPCTDANIVFLYGGFDSMDELDSNIYLLDLKSKTWTVDSQHKNLFREGHLATYIGDGNVLVFGGIPTEDGFINGVNDVTRDRLGFSPDVLMMVYNIYDKKWIAAPPFALDGAPESRSRHASCLSPDGTKLYVSGGIHKSLPLDDLYTYDLKNGKWSTPVNFVSRFNHSISIHGDKLYAFGGIDRDMNHYKNVITYYSLSNGTIGEISNITDVRLADGIGSNLSSATSYLSYQCERLYLPSDFHASVQLDIKLPLWTNPELFDISMIDLRDFKRQSILNMVELNLFFMNLSTNITDYVWNEAFVANDSLFMLGGQKESNIRETNATQGAFGINTRNYDSYSESIEYDQYGEPVENIDPEVDEPDRYSKINSLMEIKLKDFEFAPTTKDPDTHSLVSDLEKMYLDEEFSDFDIYTLNDSENKTLHFDVDLAKLQDNQNFKVIRVHKSILAARWEHFRRVLSSGMNEVKLGRMFIPEPFRLIRGMIYYLYTETLNEAKIYESYTIIDLCELLHLTDVYELQGLRTIVLERMFEAFEGLQNSMDNEEEAIEICLSLWRCLNRVGESTLLLEVLSIIKKKWKPITNSVSFTNLTKQELIELCK